MSKEIDIIANIIKSVLTALYQSFLAAVLLAFVSMFVFLYVKEHGWEKGNLIKVYSKHGLEILRKVLLFEEFFFGVLFCNDSF